MKIVHKLTIFFFLRLNVLPLFNSINEIIKFPKLNPGNGSKFRISMAVQLKMTFYTFKSFQMSFYHIQTFVKDFYMLPVQI
jgi:hypothetical protein